MFNRLYSRVHQSCTHVDINKHSKGAPNKNFDSIVITCSLKHSEFVHYICQIQNLGSSLCFSHKNRSSPRRCAAGSWFGECAPGCCRPRLRPSKASASLLHRWNFNSLHSHAKGMTQSISFVMSCSKALLYKQAAFGWISLSACSPGAKYSA